MARFYGLSIAVLVGGVTTALPAAAQSGNRTTSLTHGVSVTVPSRVKVQVHRATDELALRVHANRAWVVAIKSGADSLLASGSGSAARVDTTVVFRDGVGATGGASGTDQTIVLTMSAP
jgi:hypothetical protein